MLNAWDWAGFHPAVFDVLFSSLCSLASKERVLREWEVRSAIVSGPGGEADSPPCLGLQDIPAQNSF